MLIKELKRSIVDLGFEIINRYKPNYCISVSNLLSATVFE